MWQSHRARARERVGGLLGAFRETTARGFKGRGEGPAQPQQLDTRAGEAAVRRGTKRTWADLVVPTVPRHLYVYASPRARHIQVRILIV